MRLPVQRQRTDLDHLLAHAETRVRTAFTTAQAQMTPLLAEFERAYTAEYNRVTANLSDADEDLDERELSVQRAAHLRHWLITSGWRKRLQGAFSMTAHQAAQVTLAALKDSQGQALELGTTHARALMTAAMRPAIRAGMDWQPNAVGATPRKHRRSRSMSKEESTGNTPRKPVVNIDADPHNRNWIRQLERERQQEQQEQQQPPSKTTQEKRKP